MDAILEGTEDLTLQDVLNIQADKTDTPDDTEAVKSLKTKLNPTREEKLALWAKAHGVAISNPALCKVLHCAKEKADHILEGVFRRLRNETPELLDENNLHILLFLIYQDLESEKEASSFLYGIVGQEEGDC